MRLRYRFARWRQQSSLGCLPRTYLTDSRTPPWRRPGPATPCAIERALLLAEPVDLIRHALGVWPLVLLTEHSAIHRFELDRLEHVEDAGVLQREPAGASARHPQHTR